MNTTNLSYLNAAKHNRLHQHAYPQLNTFYDDKYKTSWCYMDGEPRPCFTPTLLNSFKDYTSDIKQEMTDTEGEKYDFIVVSSSVEGVFNLGGDLNLFLKCIEQRDHAALRTYAIHCIDILYENISHLKQNLTTIALVQGDALGGGFESAMASNVLIAEKGVKMGLPEVLFNLFPGMGAYSLLSRRVSASKAEQIILSGKIYTSDELYKLGIIDFLAEKGEGESAVYDYIKNANKSKNSFQAIRKVRDVCSSITYDELKHIADIWVDAALKLTPRDLRMMKRLIKSQTQKSGS